MTDPEVLDLLYKRHPSFKKTEPTPCAQKTDTIHENLQYIKNHLHEQAPVDLTPILERLDRIEVELASINKRKEELDEREMEVLRLFALALEKQTR